MKNKTQTTILFCVLTFLLSFGKVSAKTYTFFYNPHDSLVITVPNVFTPNGDGINDTWSIIIHDYGTILFDLQTTVYDRWGITVFETTDIREVWLGHTTTGRTCSEGSYFYVISYTNSITNQPQKLNGFIELVR